MVCDRDRARSVAATSYCWKNLLILLLPYITIYVIPSYPARSLILNDNFAIKPSFLDQQILLLVHPFAPFLTQLATPQAAAWAETRPGLVPRPTIAC